MVNIEIIGYMAGTLGIIAFLPQVIKSWKTKSTRDISLGMFILLILSVSLWITYGFFIKNIPVISTNIFIGAMILIILFFKLKYK